MQLNKLLVYYVLIAILFLTFNCSRNSDTLPDEIEDLEEQFETEPQIHFGNLELKTREDLENFYNNYIVEVTGNLTVGVSTPPQISNINDLAKLNRLKRVKGGLTIVRTLIQDLEGLDSLESVNELVISNNGALRNINNIANTHTKRVDIIENNSLESLEGLASIDSVLTKLLIWGSHNLHDLTGLENVKHVGDLEIIFNNSLTSFAGLHNLKKVDGDLKVIRNDKLENFVGLSSLETISEKLDIYGNAVLENLMGIESLRNLNELEVTFTPNLSNFEGLGGVNSINKIYLFANEAIESLAGFENLVTANDIFIKKCPTIANIDAFNNLEEAGGILIEDSDRITTINSFSKLRIARDIQLKNMVLLESINAFHNLEQVGYFYFAGNTNLINMDIASNARVRFFSISSNTSIQQIDFISQFESLGGINLFRNTSLAGDLPTIKSDTIPNVWISRNPKMTSLNGLKGLKKISDLRISEMDGLADISGLSEVEQVYGIYFANNHKIRDLNSFSKLETVAHAATFSRNDLLDNFCGLAYWVNSGDYSNNLLIEHNAYNPSIEDIKEGNCSSQ